MKFGKIRDMKLGVTRIVRVFLWTPLELQGQTRWLETVQIKQWCSIYDNKWINQEWADSTQGAMAIDINFMEFMKERNNT